MSKALEDLVRRISAQVGGGDPAASPARLRREVLNAQKELGIGIDDICARIISAVHAAPESPLHRAELMDEILSLHVWYRLHRGLMWHKIEGAARYAPVAAQFLKVETTVRRCAGKRQVSSGVSNHLLGLLSAAFEDYEAAARLFSLAPFTPSTFMAGFYNGSSTFQPPSVIWKGLAETAAPLESFFTVRRTYLAQAARGAGPVFVFSADAHYFNGLAPGMLDSLLAAGKDVDVEIVVIADPKLVHGVATELIAALDQAGAPGRIVVVETGLDVRTLSAVARYLWAGEQLTANRRSCLVFDMDVHFTPEAMEAIHLLTANSDLGLSYSVYGRAAAPWAAYLAGATYVRSGALGEFFLERFRWFVGKNMVAGRPQWFIDQNAIFATEYLTSRLFPAGNRANLAGLLNQILANLEVDKVTTIKRNAVG